MKHKHFLSITDFSSDEILKVLKTAKELKDEFKQKKTLPEYFKNKSLVMIFEKPSLRTRLSFEIGMTKLGGHAVYLGPDDIGMGKRESVADIAKVASSMGEIIMARTFKHAVIEELAKYSSVPVINGLSNLEHPCQTVADLLTIQETKDSLSGIKIAYIGDSGNNVVHSLTLASGILGMHIITASPQGYWMNKKINDKAEQLAKKSGGTIEQTDTPEYAVTNADIIYTDTWISMGDEAEKKERLQIFKQYQVTKEVMNMAKKDALFMHDLPAYRGNEVTAEVIDGKQSVVIQQAENRLWAQMALMIHLLQSKGGDLYAQ